MGRDRAVDDLRDGVALGHPRREREPPARDEYAACLGERGFGLREVEDPEIHRDRVERCILEGQLVRVPLDEGQRRVQPPRLVEHCRRHVETDRLGAARGRRPRDDPRAAGHVEQPRPGPHAGGVEERVEVEAGVGPALDVPRRRAIPAGALEFPEVVSRHDAQQIANAAAETCRRLLGHGYR